MLKGIDVYHGDGNISWASVAGAGAAFAIIKATQGADEIDPAYHDNVQGARAAGLYVGAYHYFTPTGDGAHQAQHYLTTVGDMTNLLVPFLDLEDAGDMTSDDLTASALAFIGVIHSSIGRGAILYASPSFVDERLIAADLNSYPLWIASYTHADAPKMPQRGWAQWTFWQHSESGSWSGVPGDGTTDLDVFNGDRMEMEQFVVR